MARRQNVEKSDVGFAGGDQVDASPLREDALVRLRIDFAQRCYTNAQDLIRLTDQKAGYLLTTIGVLSAALSALAIRLFSVIPTYPWQVFLQRVGVVIVLEYFGMAFIAVFTILQVLVARSNTLRPDTDAHGLIFPLTLLERCERDEIKYLAKLAETTEAHLLHEYANQITEVSHIYSIKQQHLNSALAWLRWAVISWGVSVFLMVFLVLFI